MSYPENYVQEDLFGLGWADSGIISSEGEGLRVRSIARLIGAMLGALGSGLYVGGEGAIVDGALVISELGLTAGTAETPVLVPGACLADSLGVVAVHADETTLAASAFPAGTSYVHVQAGATARADLGCGYYVDPSDTPAPDALLVCQVTKVGDALTAVDNGVRLPPAIADRIPWAGLVRTHGATETLLALLTTMLGANYLGTAPPASVDARLTALEASGVGGTGGTPLLDALLTSAGLTDLQVATAAAAEAITAHLAAAHATGSSSSGTETIPVAAEQWDVVAANKLRLAMQVTHMLPDSAATLRDTMIVVEGHYGRGERGGVNFVDEVNSEF